MKFENTSHKLACIMDDMKGIEKKKGAYLQKVSEIMEPGYLRTYSAEHRENERLSLNTAYLSTLVKDVPSLAKRCDELRAAFEKDIAAKTDTAATVQLCVNYLAVAGSDYEPGYMEIIGKPLRVAGDIRSMRELYRLCAARKEGAKEIPFDDVMGDYNNAMELNRKLELLCNSIMQQLPDANIDVDIVAAASPVLDKWGVVNLINYAGEVKASIDGDEYTPEKTSFGSFNFVTVR